MRKIVANTFMTLDGVMQAPGGPEEDPIGGFKHGGWSVNYWDDMMAKTIMDGLIGKPFDLLLGRNAMAAGKLNGARKYVVSKTLAKADWENSKLITGEVAKEISRLKEQDGPEIQVHGSSDLIQTLLKHDFIDEFHVWIFPLTVGGGKRLFGEGTMPAAFKQIDCKISTTGVIIATYLRDGDVRTGSVALEKPTKAELERRRRLKEEK
jgi:dihydrofolate reductase